MIIARILFACVLAFGLLGTVSATRTGAELVGVSAAMAQSVAAKKSAATLQERLKAKGAMMVPRSELPPKLTGMSRPANNPSCQGSSCWCYGVKSCLKLTDKICKHFRCNSDAGQPACWCDL